MDKVLLTGSNGFLGKYIYDHLSKSYEIITLSRSGANIIADLSIEQPMFSSVDMVIHCAGKAHNVPKSEIEKQEFFQVNVTGTSNLLNSLKLCNKLPKSFLFISSVSVYGREIGTNINEDSPLLAKDPYGLSKIEAEKLIKSWCDDNNVICTILRLPLLVGKNPPGNLGAMVSAINKGYYFNIGGGKSKKSMILAEDIATLIPDAFSKGGIYNLSDGFNPDFKTLSSAISFSLKKQKPLNIPFFIAKIFAILNDFVGSKIPLNSLKLKKITSDLTFDDSKARKVFFIKTHSVVDYIRKNGL